MDPLNNPVLRRRGHLNIEIKNREECYYCKTSPLKETDIFCPSCGFPQNGTNEDQVKFIQAKKLLLIRIDQMHESVGRARNALFGAAALFLVNYLIVYFQLNSTAVIIEGAIVVSLFVGYGIWSTKNPFPAVLSGLITFATLLLIYAFVNPLSIFAGIIWKVIIFSALIYGLRTAREAKKMEEELKTEKVDLNAGR
ncbi:MAG TPA: hypothetical protein VL651_14140 [Bacteroidia bacterium]|jgi:hypothetical protein|nr:hypothetical protein [Bacteroidia bacterium]